MKVINRVELYILGGYIYFLLRQNYFKFGSLWVFWSFYGVFGLFLGYCGLLGLFWGYCGLLGLFLGYCGLFGLLWSFWVFMHMGT